MTGAAAGPVEPLAQSITDVTDVDSPTTALELHERLGYREIKRTANFEKQIYSTSSHQSL